MGDSAFDENGIPDWTKPDQNGNWLHFHEFPRINQPFWPAQYTWLRLELPIEIPDSYLILKDVSYNFQIYKGVELIYQHGQRKGTIAAVAEDHNQFLVLKSKLGSQVYKSLAEVDW